MIGQATFNEVSPRSRRTSAARLTKFLSYFGTGDGSRWCPARRLRDGELPRSPKEYQEFRLEEQTSMPYLKLIQATPRIYGNGPQDWLQLRRSAVERYDGAVSGRFPSPTSHDGR
jgi:hypothetical protein